MRRLLTFFVILTALAAGVSGAQAATAPDDGYVVYKDLRGRAVTEVRDAQGRFLYQEALRGGRSGETASCLDPRHRFFGPRWRETWPAFLVNGSSIPPYLDRSAALGDLLAGDGAWQSPFVTDCPFTFGPSAYRASYGGETGLSASLADLTTDGVNVVEFRSLAGTMCDGAVACTIIEYDRGRINEADMIFESDLGRYGYADLWSTDDTTWTTSTEGRFALVDVAAHEFGHFAGLDHVDKSPALTMYPLIHDGMQTLGLGDMRGLEIRY